MTSIPPPEPRSRTTSPWWSSATAVGFPQPSDASAAAPGSSPSCSALYSASPKSPPSPQQSTLPQQPPLSLQPQPPDAAARAASAYRSRTFSRSESAACVLIGPPPGVERGSRAARPPRD